MPRPPGSVPARPPDEGARAESVGAGGDDERIVGNRRPILQCAPLLFPGPVAARLCSLSPRTWAKLNAAGKVPRALTVGRRRLWVRAELERWVEAGCPNRESWEALRQQGGRP